MFRILISVYLMLLATLPVQAAILDIQTWQTENGAKVMYVYLPEIPMVDIRIVFGAGSARDDNHHPGIAYLTNQMLNEGSVHHSALQLAETFETVGAKFMTGAGLDYASVNLRSLTDSRYLQPALAGLAEIVAHPDFPESALHRVKNETLTAIQVNKQNPAAVADELFYQSVYADHPYGHPILGYDHSIQALTLDHIKKFYKKYYVAANALIVIIGDVKRDLAEQIANQIITELPKGQKAPPLPAPIQHDGHHNKQLSFPASQTYIRIGSLATDYHDPINDALQVGNYILGGKPLISRLFTIVRGEHGLSYNIASSFTPYASPGIFIIGLQTRNNTAKQAIDLSIAVLNQFMQQGPSADEVKKAKQGIIDSFLNHISSNANILDIITTIGFYELPLNYLDTYQERIAAITVADINAAFKKVINPSQLWTVTVGGFNKISSDTHVKTTNISMLPVVW